MKLTEILNKKVDYTVIKATNDTFKTRATIGDREITFTANSTDDGGDDDWEISFSEMQPGRLTTFDRTGSGNELEVFSMVKDSIIEFISRQQPQVMVFTADKSEGNEKNNRANLYARLIAKFKVPGYAVEREKLGQTSEIFRIVRQ